MCGIVGGIGRGVDQSIVKSMLETILHRGPDGAHIERVSGHVCLGHARLAILDLSVTADQPMRSACGRYVIVYNGEVYNFVEIASVLRGYGYNFVTQSDTEVVLAAYKMWGKDSFKLFRGMFAFCIWDSVEQKAVLVRDRFGVKPIYTRVVNGVFYFSSELKCLANMPVANVLNVSALSNYLHLGYFGSDSCFIKGVSKLEPGSWLEIDSDGSCSSGKYWRHADSLDSLHNKNISDKEWSEVLLGALVESVKLRMVSDVPVGLFLSGGLDSNLLAYILSSYGYRDISAYTIGIKGDHGNPDVSGEVERASLVARHLGLKHYSYSIGESDFHDFLDSLESHIDEPISDVSFFPTFKVAQFAGKNVKVCLSADGADEFFFGYKRMLYTKRFWGVLRHFSEPYKRFVEDCFDQMIFSSFKVGRTRKFDDKLQKLAGFLSAPNPYDGADHLGSIFSFPEISALFLPGALQKSVLSNFCAITAYSIREHCLHESSRYLPDDIFCKVDRASMLSSVEAREPFADHLLFELSMKLPDHLKYSGGKGKVILRDLIEQLGGHLDYSSKKGFSIPINQWIYSYGRKKVEACIKRSAAFECVFDMQVIDSMLNMFFEKRVSSIGIKLYSLMVLSIMCNQYKVMV